MIVAATVQTFCMGFKTVQPRAVAKNYSLYTPNANMADHSVIARDELHESEASEASVFCFDNASPGKSCFVDGLVCFISLCLRGFELLNAARRESRSPLRGRQTK